MIEPTSRQIAAGEMRAALELTLNDILRAIGPPRNRTLMQSSGQPMLQRATWRCGCVVESADASSDPDTATVRWMRCAQHTPQRRPAPGAR